MTATPDSRPRVVPEWLEHLAALAWRVLVVVGLVVVLGYLATIVATVTAAILVSLVFAATFAPLVLRLRDRGWARTKAAGVVTLGIVLLVVVTLAVIVLAFVPYVPQVIGAINDAVASLRAALDDMQVPPELVDLVDRLAGLVRGWLSAQLAALVAPIAQAATVGLLSLFTVFFLLQDGDKGWLWVLQTSSDWRRERITTAGNDALQRVGGYLRGLAVLAAVNAIRDFVLLWILGVPLAGPLAVLVFILGFVPYFGSLVATVLIVLVTWGTVGVEAAVIFLVAITLLNVVEGNVMMPQVYGRTVHVHPAVALLALLAGGAAGGIIGVFIAIPVVAFVIAVGGSLIAVLDTKRPEERLAFVPGWLDRLAQWSWRLLLAIGLMGLGVVVATALPGVVVPAVLSLILAATFLPIVDWLTDRGWRRGVASIAATIGGIGLIVLVVIASVVVMVPQVREIVEQSTNGAGSIAGDADGLGDLLRQVVEAFGLGAVAAIVGIGATIVLAGLTLLISTVLCYYFLSDGRRFWQAVVTRLPVDRRRPVDVAGRKAVDVLGGYMIATGVISVFGAATQCLIMFVLGIPLALPLGVLAFFGGFIPYIGSFITTLAAFLVTVAVGTPQQIAIMGIWTLVFNIVQGNVVAPLVYGRAVSIHPAVVLLAIPAGNAVAGVLGMFLAVPVIGVVAATWRTVLRVFGDAPGGALAADPAEGARDDEGAPEPGTPSRGEAPISGLAAPVAHPRADPPTEPAS